MQDIHIGALNIGGKNDGVTLIVRLQVVDSDVVGFGHYTDSIHNSSFGVAIAGKVHATGVGKAEQLFALAGNAFPPLPGASNIPTLNITLDGIWGTSGSAQYTVWHDTPTIESHSGQVHANWQE